MWKRSAKFWLWQYGRNFGICMAVALLLCIFFAYGAIFERGDQGDMLWNLYPLYLILVGNMYCLIGGVSYFRSMIPLLLGVNVTRRGAVVGLLLYTVGFLAGILALAAMVWLLAGWWDLMELIAALGGILLFMAGIGLLCGILEWKYGGVGKAIGVVCCAIFGGAMGVCVGIIADREIAYVIAELFGRKSLWLLAAGAVWYILAGMVSLGVTRKMEARL